MDWLQGFNAHLLTSSTSNVCPLPPEIHHQVTVLCWTQVDMNLLVMLDESLVCSEFHFILCCVGQTYSTP